MLEERSHMELPESWRFLGSLWWVLHIVAVGLVFYVGYLIGRSSAENEAKEKPKSDVEKF